MNFFDWQFAREILPRLLDASLTTIGIMAHELRTPLSTAGLIADALLKALLSEKDFEILEDKTEEIEEIQADDNYYIHTELGSFKGRKMDIAFANKINELARAVNSLGGKNE